jgi:hypothetical protein
MMCKFELVWLMHMMITIILVKLVFRIIEGFKMERRPKIKLCKIKENSYWNVWNVEKCVRWRMFIENKCVKLRVTISLSLTLVSGALCFGHPHEYVRVNVYITTTITCFVERGCKGLLLWIPRLFDLSIFLLVVVSSTVVDNRMPVLEECFSPQFPSDFFTILLVSLCLFNYTIILIFDFLCQQNFLESII